MISASKVGDLWSCAYQFRDGLDLLPDDTNEAALTGTLVHKMIECYLDGVCDEPIVAGANAERARRIFARWRDWWESGEHQGLPWQTEVPYAISLRTGEGRRLPSDGQRDYSQAKRDEIPGTGDLVALTDDAVVVWDVKTTSRPEYTTEAKRNKQLLTLGLAASRAHGRDKARVGLNFANEFDTRLESAEFDALDLDLFEEDLRAKVASIPTSEPTPGPHCRFCRHRHACKAAPKQFRNEGKRRAT